MKLKKEKMKKKMKKRNGTKNMLHSSV